MNAFSCKFVNVGCVIWISENFLSRWFFICPLHLTGFINFWNTSNAFYMLMSVLAYTRSKWNRKRNTKLLQKEWGRCRRKINGCKRRNLSELSSGSSGQIMSKDLNSIITWRTLLLFVIARCRYLISSESLTLACNFYLLVIDFHNPIFWCCAYFVYAKH